VVTTAEGQEMAGEFGMQYFETSAKNPDTHVQELKTVRDTSKRGPDSMSTGEHGGLLAILTGLPACHVCRPLLGAAARFSTPLRRR
jgi:hypothetical protein